MITLDLTSLIFLALATWRVTNMITDESCPFDACVWIRKHLNIGKVLDCPYCTSVWVSLAMLLLWYTEGLYVIVYLLAVSTLTIVIHHIVKTFTAFYFYVFGE